MSRSNIQQHRWTDLLDRDADRLISGRDPDNEDLTSLVPMVAEIRAFGAIELSEQGVADHAAGASRRVQSSISERANTPTKPSRTRLAVSRLKARATAVLASAAMLTSIAGVAWASDNAVPGDWNYGIDRALESIGIGAGGSEERLAEVAVIQSDESPPAVTATTSPARDSDSSSDKKTDSNRSIGLEKASESVIANGSTTSEGVRTGVSSLLLHLLNSGDVDGSDIAQMAKSLGGPPEDLPGNGNQSNGNQSNGNQGTSADAKSKTPNKP